MININSGTNAMHFCGVLALYFYFMEACYGNKNIGNNPPPKMDKMDSKISNKKGSNNLFFIISGRELLFLIILIYGFSA